MRTLSIRVSRQLIVLAVIMVLVSVVAIPAAADDGGGIPPIPVAPPSAGPGGSATVQSGDATLDVQVPGSPGSPGTPSATPSAGSSNSAPAPVRASEGSRPLTQAEKDQLAVGNAACVATKAAGLPTPAACQPQAAAPAPAAPPPAPGAPPAPPVPANPGLDLALSLRTQLQITMPALHTAPPLGTQAIVGYPTWLWVDPNGAGPITNTATAGPLTVTIMATPNGVDWDTGDGHVEHCDGPGTPFVPDVTNPDTTKPSCSHTYTVRSTHGDPNGTFTLRGSMTWNVRWEANTGQGGTLAPVTVTATAPIKVVELQAELD